MQIDAVTQVEFASSFMRIAGIVNDIAKQKGWWDNPNRNKGEMIALMHSELSECLEGIRTGSPDSHLPHLRNEAVELADVIIRIMDYAVAHGIDLPEAIIQKIHFNAGRQHKHGGKLF